MPHLVIQYSANLDGTVDMGALCRALSAVLAGSGIFPAGGIRVRAYAAEDFAIADNHPRNAFADMVLRIGSGRSAVEKADTGTALMAAASAHFAALLNEPHFALSLEIVDIDAAASWKQNTIHPRLPGPG